MNLKQREAQREEYLYLENWLKEHTNDLMTPSYFLDELTLLNESQIQYIMMAYMIPRVDLEREIDYYDSHNFLSKPDELKFVSSLAQKYGVDRETIIKRIRQVRIMKQPKKERIIVKKRKKTQK